MRLCQAECPNEAVQSVNGVDCCEMHGDLACRIVLRAMLRPGGPNGLRIHTFTRDDREDGR
jgi:hypothetical protein